MKQPLSRGGLAAIILCLLIVSKAVAISEGNLVVVNEPSAMSAGADSLVELDPSGTLVETPVPEYMGITGMRRVVFDANSGNVFYSVSSWPDQVFEIREIDPSGDLVETYSHPDFDSGNISMAVDKRNGDLYIANGSYIYRKEAGQAEIVPVCLLPYTGIGDLEIDSRGNLYLSDPFINDVVYKVFVDGTIEIYADITDGIENPYGLAVDTNGNLFVANNLHSGATIIKIDPDHQVSVFTSQNVEHGILDMTFDSQQMLFAANREQNTIYMYDTTGNGVLFADSEDGLHVPSSMAFVIFKADFDADTDSDGDVDGSDVYQFARTFDAAGLPIFCAAYGSK